VIIPTFNEAENLEQVLRALLLSARDEVIVVDGGSGDGTQEIAKRGGARVLQGVCADRGQQMNLGAKEAQGELLFFLHGDTVVPDGALDLIDEVCADGQVVGGGFLRQFDSDSIWLDWTCRLADWRSEHWGVFLGDQGIFVRREVFERLGGFDKNLTCCEDLHFSMKLKNEGAVVALRPAVLSSARRFERLGPLLTTLRDGWLAAREVGGSRLYK